MKTLGERIKQAREALGWSGLDLATRVGYKTQSGISNLEGRATGSGGNKIGKIAQELNVSLDWLMHGPDADSVPFLPPRTSISPTATYTTLAAETDNLYRLGSTRELDDWTLAAVAIMSKLNESQKAAMVAKMREYSQYLGPPRDGQALSVAGQ